MPINSNKNLSIQGIENGFVIGYSDVLTHQYKQYYCQTTEEVSEFLNNYFNQGTDNN